MATAKPAIVPASIARLEGATMFPVHLLRAPLIRAQRPAGVAQGPCTDDNRVLTGQRGVVTMGL